MAVTLESLKKSVGKKNSKSKIFAWLADMELAAGDLDTALQRVNGGLTLYPNDIAAKLVRAKVLFQKGEFDECVQECESILVKDPFSLAAQKIMGDAYDQLGNVAERNLCYRRYHDMDPLNTFWKEEFDVIPEAAVAAVAAAADEFSMPAEGDDALNLNLSDSEEDSGAGLFDNASLVGASGESAEGDEFSGAGLFEKSSEQEDSLFNADNEDVENSIDKAFGETFGEEDDSSVEESSSQSSPFSSSFLDEEPAADEQTSTASQTASFTSIDDDPFAALAAMLPNSDASEDATIDELSASLDSVMESIKSDDVADKPVEEFPADDNVSGNDVTAALSDMFGLDDDLEAEETPAAKASDFASVAVDEKAEENASKIFETQSSANADKPQSVDDAFDSIFGEDELPEEKPSASAAPAAETVAEVPSAEDVVAEESVAFEAPAEETAEEPAEAAEQPAADKPVSVDDAFDSIFGEDELPEELPAASAAPAAEAVAEETVVEAPAAESSSMFEKSSEWTPDAAPVADLEEPAEVAEQPAADKPVSVDDAFDSIFGEDELPEELPAASAAPAAEAVAEETVVEAPAAESSSMFEKSSEWTPDAAPAAELEEPAEVAEQPAADKPVSVDDAFDSIFGEDELPEEKPVEAPALRPDPFAETFEAPAEELSVAETELDVAPELEAAPELETAPSFVAEVDVPSDPVIASPMDFVNDDSGVSDAFSSIFGEDDDLPEENASAPKAAEADDLNFDMPAAEETAPENTLAEQVNLAEAELEMPAVEPKSETSDIAQEMGGAFASMFGDDDDLDLPDFKSDTADVAEAPQATSAAIEESIPATEENLSNDLDKSFDSLFGSDDDLSMTEEEKPVAGNPDLASLETEVSGAFKGLFDMEDDSLTEESKPSNSGVDFLMSGDSDDEISAGLIKNPDASLDRSVNNLDDSMGTRTLAEIYFDQGLYGDALKMYQELLQREPANEELAARKEEIEKIYREKFGGNA